MSLPPFLHPFQRGLFFAGVAAGLVLAPALSGAAPSDDWPEMNAILRRIVPPVFPARDFEVTAFGARGDGRTDCHDAFAEAIEACARAGGGRVVVPAGVFYCDGPIHLQSNVNLHVGTGATIRFGTDPARYLPAVLTRYEGTLLRGHSPRIYARGATNIAITGEGTIDGNGRATIERVRAANGMAGSELRTLGANGTPVGQRQFGEGHWLRTSTLQPFDCTNVLIEDVTVIDSPFWVVHPVLCRNVTVRRVKVDSLNANNDGCDPDSSADVLIEDCDFHTGDDAIAIKSGRDQDGWKVARPAENIVIRRCVMRAKDGDVCIGSEMSGGVRNVFVEDCRFLTGSSALYFKGNLDRGGVVEHVRARRIEVGRLKDALVRFETSYHSYRGGNSPPTFRDFLVEDVHCSDAGVYGVYLEGVPTARIRDVTLRRIVADTARSPAWLRQIERVRLDAVRINGATLPEDPPETPPGEAKRPIGG